MIDISFVIYCLILLIIVCGVLIIMLSIKYLLSMEEENEGTSAKVVSSEDELVDYFDLEDEDGVGI